MNDSFVSARPSFNVASLKCASSLPVRMVESSRTVGWTSLLLDHHQVLNAEAEFETSATPDHTIVVMTRGEQLIEVYERNRWKRATYRHDSIGMTPGGMTDRMRRRVNAAAGPAFKINLYIPHALFDEAADHLGRAGGSTVLHGPMALGYRDGAVRMATQTLLRAARAGAPSLYSESMAHWLTVHLLTSLRSNRGHLEELMPTESIKTKRLGSVLEFIEHNLSEEVSLDQLAREAAVSKFHFTRLFREATGSTPHRWLSDRRLDAGRRLLETTDLSVSEIAHRCGFSRANYFATAFSSKFGVTPSDYRLAF